MCGGVRVGSGLRVRIEVVVGARCPSHQYLNRLTFHIAADALRRETKAFPGEGTISNAILEVLVGCIVGHATRIHSEEFTFLRTWWQHCAACMG